MARHNHRFVPSSVTTSLLIDCADVQIDATGTYDATSGCLESVTINHRHVSIAQVSAALAILCPDSIGPWSDDLDGDTLNVLINEDAQDAADAWGDSQRDMNMEAMQ